MLNKKLLTGVCTALILLSHYTQAVELVKTKTSSLDLNGQIQTLGVLEHLKDPVRDDTRVFLFLKQSRLQLKGTQEELSYYIQLRFGGEEAADENSSLGLLDFYTDMPASWLWDALPGTLRVGQFKVPYSSEKLASSKTLLFAKRSIQTLAFGVGRDVGAAIIIDNNNFDFTGGIFTGGGADIPERYLPEKFGFPLIAIRTGITNSDKSSFHINALYTKDSEVGHSTVLKVKYSDYSILQSSKWNPFIGTTPIDLGSLFLIGGDMTAEVPLGVGKFSMSGELNYGTYKNTYGTLSVYGGSFQGAFHQPKMDIGVRYAFLKPDNDFSSGIGDEIIHEVTPALTYKLKGDNVKLIVDMPMLINVPVATESGVGSYVLSEQPDQITSGSVGRQKVVQLRTILQVLF